MNLEEDYFTIKFAGRNIAFAFSSSLDANGALIGNVQCLLRKENPEADDVNVGNFTFTQRGHTNLKSPDDGDQIIIGDDLPSLYVALDFIRESLEK